MSGSKALRDKLRSALTVYMPVGGGVLGALAWFGSMWLPREWFGETDVEVWEAKEAVFGAVLWLGAVAAGIGAGTAGVLAERARIAKAAIGLIVGATLFLFAFGGTAGLLILLL